MNWVTNSSWLTVMEHIGCSVRQLQDSLGDAIWHKRILFSYIRSCGAGVHPVFRLLMAWRVGSTSSKTPKQPWANPDRWWCRRQLNLPHNENKTNGMNVMAVLACSQLRYYKIVFKEVDEISLRPIKNHFPSTQPPCLPTFYTSSPCPSEWCCN